MAAILVTGRPGSGKTTLVRRVVEALRAPASGFYTRETRGRDGRRTGFELVTLDGQVVTLAHVGIAGRQRVGRYGVDIEALERVGVPAIEAAVESGRLAVIDEIGKMELCSAAFREAVAAVMDSDRPVLATIPLFRTPFLDALRSRDDVTVIELTVSNRDALGARVSALLAAGQAG